MSKKFPTTPEELIEAIKEDAPAVYDILRENYFSEFGDGSAPPHDVEMVEQLEKYGDDNWDVHYWAGRWAILKELLTVPDPSDTIGRDNAGRFLNDMTSAHYKYTLLRCDKCDAVHRLHDSDEFNAILGVCGGDGFDVEYGFKCPCGQDGDQDSPDLFF